MSKTLITACLALVAFAAFVLPASASAANDPQLTEGGVVVAAGSTIVGTASETKFTNTEGNVTQTTCSTANMTGTVKKNSGGTVEAEVPKGSTTFRGTGAVNSDNGLNECTGSFGSAYITVTTTLCVKSDPTMAEDEFQVIGAACGSTGKVKFIIGSTTAGACEYESTGTIKGDYITGGTEASLTTRDTSEGSGTTRISGGFLCPSSGALKMTFTLETEDGTKLTAVDVADDPQLTDSGSLLSAVGNPAINGTSSGSTEFTTTGGSTLATCTAATMRGRLLANSSSTVEGEIAPGNTSFSGTGGISSDNGLPECTSSFGNAYITVTTALCVKADPTMTEESFQVTGAACGSAGKVTFIIGSTTAGSCKYEATGAVKGTYTTGGTEAKFSTTDTSEGSGSKLISGGFLCPSSGALKMTFTLETVNPATKLTVS